MTVIHGHIIGTVQIGSIHAINGGDDSMETGSEVADVPHPTKHWRYVSQSRTESEHREQYSQNRSNEYGNLQVI